MQQRIRFDFKRNFLAGLITILPLWLTLFLVWVVFNWVSTLAIPFLSPILKIYVGKGGSLLAKIASFILTIFVIWFVGVLATRIVSRRILTWGENVLVKIPLLSDIYFGFRKLIRFIFKERRDFKTVVMVEFPRAGIYSIGFLTGKGDFGNLKNIGTVFIPTVPNPTTGFLVVVRQKDIKPLDMTFDEAARMLLSGGIVSPEKYKSGNAQKKRSKK
ncbi:MAG: DUF502 domain-containing protein [Elusimicrobia bacterium]|nr:DUF502 domain-containing protein [Elusimicrobiota bacterium]